MPLPFEAVVPFAIIAGLISVTGYGLMATQRMGNAGKPRRHDVGEWELKMMERDRRLTGSASIQSDNPIAPPEFAVNSVWHIHK
ncbi:hypothetical protein BJ085DRAFT_4738, partial [Dimargaris cristalligena]